MLTTYKTLMVMAGWRCHDGMCTYKVQLRDPIAAPVAVLLIRRCVERGYMSHDWAAGEEEGTHVFVFHNSDFFRSYKTFYCVYYHHCLYILYALFRHYSLVWTLLETWCVGILTVNMQLLKVMKR